MFLLRMLIGGLASSILRLAITAGVLFLCYLLVLKPMLSGI
jgi:hypothetical protein